MGGENKGTEDVSTNKPLPASPPFRYGRYWLCIVSLNHLDPAITRSILGWHCKRCGMLLRG